MKGAVEESWKGSYRMEIWMIGSTAHSLLFLPDHDLLVVGESDGNVRVLDETTRGPTSVICAHEGQSVIGLVALKASSKINVFASLGADGEVKIWIPNSSKPRHFEPLDTSATQAAAKSSCESKGLNQQQHVRPRIFSVCGGEKLLYSNGQVIIVFEINECDDKPLVLECAREIEPLPGGCELVETDGDTVFAIDGGDGALSAWSILGGGPARFTAARPDASPRGAARATCLRARAGTLAIGRADGGVEIRAAADGAAMAVIPRRHLGEVTHLVSGERLLTWWAVTHLVGGYARGS
jgi:hypothetical protein